MRMTSLRMQAVMATRGFFPKGVGPNYFGPT
jgi:hypothetical protein